MISGLAYKAVEGQGRRTHHAATIWKISGSTINQKAIRFSDWRSSRPRVDQMRALAELKQKQLDALKVRAGIDGVLVDLPLQVGQHVLPGAMLAKVVQPEPSDGRVERSQKPRRATFRSASRLRSTRTTA